MRTVVDVKRQNGLRKQRFYRAGQEFGPKGCGAGTGLPCGRVVIGYAGEAGPEMPVTRLQRSGYEASVGSGTIIENSKSECNEKSLDRRFGRRTACLVRGPRIAKPKRANN